MIKIDNALCLDEGCLRGAVEVDPYEVLKALEVLRKWGMKQVSYKMCKDLERHVNKTAKIVEGIVIQFNSLWIKEVDNEKD